MMTFSDRSPTYPLVVARVVRHRGQAVRKGGRRGSKVTAMIWSHTLLTQEAGLWLEDMLWPESEQRPRACLSAASGMSGGASGAA